MLGVFLVRKKKGSFHRLWKDTEMETLSSFLETIQITEPLFRIWNGFPEVGISECIEVTSIDKIDFEKYPNYVLEIEGSIELEGNTREYVEIMVDPYEKVPPYSFLNLEIFSDQISQPILTPILNAFEKFVGQFPNGIFESIRIASSAEEMWDAEKLVGIKTWDSMEFFSIYYKRLKGMLQKKGIPEWLGIYSDTAKDIMDRIKFVNDDIKFFQKIQSMEYRKNKPILRAILENLQNKTQLNIIFGSVCFIDKDLTPKSSQKLLYEMREWLQNLATEIPPRSQMLDILYRRTEEWLEKEFVS